MIVCLADLDEFKEKALQWASSFDVCCALDSNHYYDEFSKFDFALATDFYEKTETGTFKEIEEFQQKNTNRWIFGGLSYDLKNDIEALESANADGLEFPNSFLFVPKHLLIVKGEQLEIISSESEKIYNSIIQTQLEGQADKTPLQIKTRLSRNAYTETVKQIIKEISLGNIYETNFCMEFYAKNVEINPLQTYRQLNKYSPTPFANYFRWFDKHIISATPERFLAKRDNQLISQPIKGTARRGKNNLEDREIIEKLKKHPKELQENVMIVDLVRNDLTKSAEKGSVQVKELFGVYTFKQVHHLISTVVCTKEKTISNVEVVKNTFPMGSMTGAPKIKAMKLMENYESVKRGMYSGAVGYFSPDGDFDFNVIIRTILYNQTKQYLSFQVGSAITYYADAEQEYDECLLKAKAILDILT